MWPKNVECIWPKAECMCPKEAKVYVTELQGKPRVEVLALLWMILVSKVKDSLNLSRLYKRLG